jgi:hypothetical protein
MDTKGTLKDSLATCLDMQHLGIKKELHPMELENGQFELPVASWTLKKAVLRLELKTVSVSKVITVGCQHKPVVLVKQSLSVVTSNRQFLN